MNTKHIHSLELSAVLKLLANEASCEESREKIYNILPQNDFDEVLESLNKTDEAYLLYSGYGAPVFHGGAGAAAFVTRAKAGGILSMEELLQISKLYSSIGAFKIYPNQIKDDSLVKINHLDELFFALTPNKSLEERINTSIISKDEMSDNASQTLREIRRKISGNTAKIRQVLDGYIRSRQTQAYLQDAIITMRDGRFVLPVKLEHRNSVPGMVHGTSSSGSTLFIEPMQVVEMNNEISILFSKEKEEILRILESFTNEIRQEADEILRSLSAMIEIDVIFSKARLANVMNASRPIINEKGYTSLRKVRHPLIDPKKVVPIDISIGDEYNLLIVTGPNTGGKTVALKTIGLITLMTMCGMMIPAADRSEVAIFENVLANIGDEQSIEQSLSTFSAHMTQIVSILEIANSSSLVLLDELGSGTDPIEGAALAMAILEHLKSKNSTVIATTHYAELKTYALETEGVENASCEFDVETLSPTYKLLIGIPGKSNAFAISEKLGILPMVIEKAQEFMSSDEKSFERIVSRLEDSEKELAEMRDEISKAHSEAKEVREEAKIVHEKVENERKTILDRAKRQADNIIDEVKMSANFLINDLDEIRRRKSKLETSDDVRKERLHVSRKIDSLTQDTDISALNTDDEYELPRPLKKGDYVLLESFGQKGTIIQISEKSNKVTVEMGNSKMTVPIKSLRLLKAPKEEKRARNVSVRRVKKTSSAKPGGFKEVDLRGKNIDEAILIVDKFLDDSIFSSAENISIIHGKGTGVLRTGIHDHLKRHPLVKDFRLGTYGEGEDGVTIVTL